MSRYHTGMNTGAAKVVGPRRGMAPIVQLAFAGVLSIFYFANFYDWALAELLAAAKWSAALGFAGLVLLVAQRRDVAHGLAAVVPVVLLALLFLTVALSEDVSTSFVYFASIILVLAACWLFAGHVASRNAESQVFEIIANVGRFVIFSNMLLLVAGVNLGRGGYRFSGWTDNPNTLALMIAPTLIILIAQILERRRNVLLLWNVPFILMGLLLLMQADSRAGILWIGIACLALFAFRQGVGISFWVSVVLGALFVIFWNDISEFVISLVDRDTAKVNADILSGRSEMWPIGMDLFSQKPLVGHGLGTSEAMLDALGGTFREAQGSQFHNSYVTILVETGVVGGLALLMVVGTAVVCGIRRSSLLRVQKNPRWPTQALAWAILLGALGHAFFETWILSPGNANAFILWTCIWLLVGNRSAVPEASAPGGGGRSRSWLGRATRMLGPRPQVSGMVPSAPAGRSDRRF
jgi:O-antigen ligase